MPTRLLLPIALAQGLWVRQTVPRLPPATGRRGAFGPGPARALSVVGVGDSIIAGVGVERQERALVGHFARRLHERSGRPVRWRACGLNGADSTMIRERIAPVAPAADVYIVSAGVNDAVRGVSVARFSTNLVEVAATLRRKSPQAALVFAGIPPLDRFPALPWPLGAVLGARAARLQAAARAVAADLRTVCFDFPADLPPGGFARDGFHPAAEACDAWARWLLDAWLSPAERPATSDCESASPPA
jgi:lysophospholipase L1-like esterase